MKSLCSIERIAIIRWVTIAYLGAAVSPLWKYHCRSAIRVTHHAPNCHGRSSFVAC